MENQPHTIPIEAEEQSRQSVVVRVLPGATIAGAAAATLAGTEGVAHADETPIANETQSGSPEPITVSDPNSSPTPEPVVVTEGPKFGPNPSPTVVTEGPNYGPNPEPVVVTEGPKFGPKDAPNPEAGANAGPQQGNNTTQGNVEKAPQKIEKQQITTESGKTATILDSPGFGRANNETVTASSVVNAKTTDHEATANHDSNPITALTLGAAGLLAGTAIAAKKLRKRIH